jgi:hypothetical protein
MTYESLIYCSPRGKKWKILQFFKIIYDKIVVAVTISWPNKPFFYRSEQPIFYRASKMPTDASKKIWILVNSSQFKFVNHSLQVRLFVRYQENGSHDDYRIQSSNRPRRRKWTSSLELPQERGNTRRNHTFQRKPRKRHSIPSCNYRSSVMYVHLIMHMTKVQKKL